jgi:hypothetical protein
VTGTLAAVFTSDELAALEKAGLSVPPPASPGYAELNRLHAHPVMGDEERSVARNSLSWEGGYAGMRSHHSHGRQELAGDAR